MKLWSGTHGDVRDIVCFLHVNKFIHMNLMKWKNVDKRNAHNVLRTTTQPNTEWETHRVRWEKKKKRTSTKEWLKRVQKAESRNKLRQSTQHIDVHTRLSLSLLLCEHGAYRWPCICMSDRIKKCLKFFNSLKIEILRMKNLFSSITFSCYRQRAISLSCTAMNASLTQNSLSYLSIGKSMCGGAWVDFSHFNQE